MAKIKALEVKTPAQRVRGGQVWSKGTTVVPLSKFTPEQVKAIKADKKLMVSEVEIEAPEKKGKKNKPTGGASAPPLGDGTGTELNLDTATREQLEAEAKRRNLVFEADDTDEDLRILILTDEESRPGA